MSRASDVLNELELAAKKLGMSIEEAVSILMGNHPTHVVVQQHATAAQKQETAAEGEQAGNANGEGTNGVAAASGIDNGGAGGQGENTSQAQEPGQAA